MIMKKLLTILFVLMFSTVSFATTKYWTGGPGGTWTTAGNWTPVGVPGANDLVVLGGSNGSPKSGTFTVIGVPDGTILQGLLVQGYNVAAVTGPPAIPSTWYGTHVTLEGATDGANIRIQWQTATNGNLTQYQQIPCLNNIDVPQLKIASNQVWGTPQIENTLNCATSGANVSLTLSPKSMLYLGGRDVTSGSENKYVNGHLILPFYATCADNFTHKALVLMSDNSGHAEVVQALNNSDDLIGFVDESFTIMGGVADGSDAHQLGAPITTTNDISFILGGANWLCREQNCMCVFNYDYVQYYDVALQAWDSWLQIPSGQTCMTATNVDYTVGERGRGFQVFVRQKAEKLFYGHLNNAPAVTGGTYNILFPTQDINNPGDWVLLANPFASGLNFAATSGSGLAQGWSWSGDILPSFSYWDPAAATGLGDYRYYNWGDGSHDGYSPTTGRAIPRGQGFFLQADPAGSNDWYSMTVNNLARDYNGTVNIKDETIVPNVLNLSLYSTSRNGTINTMNIKFREDGKTGFSKLDVSKLFTTSTEANIYTKTADNFDVTSKNLLAVAGTTTVPVYVKVNSASSLKLVAGQISSFSPNAGMILVDRKTNTTQDLRLNAEYSFTTVAGDDDHRFDILFSSILNGINDQKGNAFNIYSFGKSITIVNNQNMTNGNVTVSDMLGREMIQNVLSNNNVNTFNTDLSTGYYIVSVRTNAGISTQKVYIN